MGPELGLWAAGLVAVAVALGARRRWALELTLLFSLARRARARDDYASSDFAANR